MTQEQMQNILSQMRAYCRSAIDRYAREYEQVKGILYVKYNFHAGLLYELEKLVDRTFSCDAEFHDAVSTAILTAACETRTPNHVGTVLVEKEAERTRADFARISPDCGPADVPYRRVICGEEKEHILSRMEQQFGFTGMYWHPIVCDKTRVDCLFVMDSVVEDRWDRILPLLSDRVYSCGEMVLSY